MDKQIDYQRFNFSGPVKHRYDFSNFLKPKDLFDKVFSSDISLNDAKDGQRQLGEDIRNLDDCSPTRKTIKKKTLFLTYKFFTV